jgi:hypothetical protein
MKSTYYSLLIVFFILFNISNINSKGAQKIPITLKGKIYAHDRYCGGIHYLDNDPNNPENQLDFPSVNLKYVFISQNGIKYPFETDALGRFNIKLKPQKYTLYINYWGYKYPTKVKNYNQPNTPCTPTYMQPKFSFTLDFKTTKDSMFIHYINECDPCLPPIP